MDDSKLLIYNSWLRVTAEAQNRGYRKRKEGNFDRELFGVLDKLERFFNQFKHIQPYIFFKASYEINGVEFIPLADFLKQKAIKRYSDYVKAKYENTADDEEVINAFKNGIKFINDFTKNNGISFLQYPKAVNEIGVPFYLIHLQEQKITFYHLHLFAIPYSSIPSDYSELIMENFDNIFLSTQQKYLSSQTMKEIGKKLMDRLN